MFLNMWKSPVREYLVVIFETSIIFSSREYYFFMYLHHELMHAWYV